MIYGPRESSYRHFTEACSSSSKTGSHDESTRLFLNFSETFTEIYLCAIVFLKNNFMGEEMAQSGKHEDLNSNPEKPLRAGHGHVHLSP